MRARGRGIEDRARSAGLHETDSATPAKPEPANAGTATGSHTGPGPKHRKESSDSSPVSSMQNGAAVNSSKTDGKDDSTNRGPRPARS
jgi:hypothetical protein